MKTLLFMLLLLPSVLFAGSIVDKATAIQINLPGDTLTIQKSDAKVKRVGNRVYIITTTAQVEIVYANFSSQFANVSVMHNWLQLVVSNSYSKTFHYTGSNMDTASFKINGVTQYRIAYGYTGSQCTSISKPIY